MTKRTISVVLEIEDHEAAKPIWNAHLGDTLLLGGKIRAIGSGNCFTEQDKINDAITAIYELVEKHTGSPVAEQILDIIARLDNGV